MNDGEVIKVSLRSTSCVCDMCSGESMVGDVEDSGRVELRFCKDRESSSGAACVSVSARAPARHRVWDFSSLFFRCPVFFIVSHR